jgi:hypothetical protein
MESREVTGFLWKKVTGGREYCGKKDKNRQSTPGKLDRAVCWEMVLDFSTV